jgi:RHS repeat-associated protein
VVFQCNLTTTIFFGSNTIEYLYNATGQELQKKVTQGATITITEYLTGFQYKNNVLLFFPHAEGYVNNTAGTYSYVFNYTDHLGNVRISYTTDASTGSLKILEENHYYPFGMKHTNYNSDVKILIKDGSLIKIKPAPVSPYKYKYNAKEYQDELGLNFYDYGARNYDPAIGRWMNIDPKSEKYLNLTPYNYVADNPMVNIDPDGKEIIFIVRGETRNEDKILTYRKGNFYHSNGKRYNPAKESLSPTLYKVLSTYRKIEKSGDSKLKKVLHTLETSKIKHFVEPGYESAVQEYGYLSSIEKGSPRGTHTTYNFSKDDDKEFLKTEGVSDDDDAAVAHEMRHQFDYDIGNHKDNAKDANENDPMEIRAVFFENLMRKTLKQLQRTRYGKPIPPEKLKNPQNNIF